MSPECTPRLAGDVCSPASPTIAQWLAAILFSGLLTGLLWPGLLQGGGLIGGDIYPYFLPQKQLLSQEFPAGRLPLWHDRTALGYPLLAESQAAVFYPPTQLLYRITDPHTAFHVCFLLHYLMAGICSWRFFRSQQLSQPAALFAALIYVCSWFPARASLEWSIIGGVWLPLTLWLADRLLQQPSVGRLSLLAAAHATHLLAGHFTLAFINQLMLAGFGLWKGLAAPQLSTSTPTPRSQSPFSPSRRRTTALLLMVSAVALALLLAAVQLRPTLELRLSSQRSGGQATFNPAYGHMPPLYTTQLLASWWYWHSPEIIQSRKILHTPLSSSADTNAVEAHFCVGLIPLGLCLCLLNGRIRRRLPAGAAGFWLLTTGISTCYAFGWLMPYTKQLPGFGFFMGPGRYTILGTLALALLTGLVLDALLRRSRLVRRWTIFTAIAAFTFVDLRWSTIAVSDAMVLPIPPYIHLPDSWLAEVLQKADAQAPVRLLAPGHNVGNLFGVSCVPQYLGLSPAAYFRDDFLPRSSPNADKPWPDAAMDAALQKLAVTHILSLDPIPLLSTDWEPVAAGPDAFLNRVWARGSEPCYLYRRRQPPARIQLLPPTSGEVRIVERHPSRWVLDVTAENAGVLQLADLPYPGWTVSVEPAPTPASHDLPESPVHRFIDVPAGRSRVTSEYQPAAFRSGASISLTTALILIAICLHPRFRRSAKASSPAHT
jgi:hypothetical protein